jgi:hypothetical protein
MCDYSLGGLPNRLAADGEELMVHKFPTHSIGLASPLDLQSTQTLTAKSGRTIWQRIKTAMTHAFDTPEVPAICVPPGAGLILRNIPLDLRGKWSVGEEEGVRFVQISAEVNTYRDALLFRNGRQVLLQDLREGMRVKVVSLGNAPVGDEEPALAVGNR